MPPFLWVKTLASCAESDDLALSVLAGCSFLSVVLVDEVFLSPPPLQARANAAPSINARIRFCFFKLVSSRIVVCETAMRLALFASAAGIRFQPIFFMLLM